MFNPHQIEEKIKYSDWWQKASITVDSHYCNTSGIMLTHHLQVVHDNVEAIFQQAATGFYGSLFNLLQQLNIEKDELKNELKVVALLHDIGKTAEDKSMVIPHPLTGKPAHKRHGLVSLMAAIEILGPELETTETQRAHIYRTVELHDMSYGLFREHQETRIIPPYSRWTYINNKIHSLPAAGLLYLLVFKLADIHGHDNIADVLWFYHAARENYFTHLNIELPVPDESDIR
jgi:hypothetical protein